MLGEGGGGEFLGIRKNPYFYNFFEPFHNKFLGSVPYYFISVYIENILSVFRLSNNIMNWISKFFSDRDACIMMNHTFTDSIFQKYGNTHGDIISLYIFIISVETLIKINHTKHIKRDMFLNKEGQTETFTNDTLIYMERKQWYRCYTMMCLDHFNKIFGLQCNVSKTKIIPIVNIYKENILCPDINLEWQGMISHYLAMYFQSDMFQIFCNAKN